MRNKLKNALKIAGTAAAVKLGGDALAQDGQLIITSVSEISGEFPETNRLTGGNLNFSGRE